MVMRMVITFKIINMMGGGRVADSYGNTRIFHKFDAFCIGNPTVNIMKILDFPWIWKSYFGDANRNSQPHCFLGWPSLVDSSPLFRCSSTFSFEVWASIFQDLLLTVLYLSENRYCSPPTNCVVSAKP